MGLHLQGSDWNGQVKLGNSQFIGVNYLQSVTPHLALGGEAFWLGQQRKSGAGFAARYANDAHIATAQVATTGLVSLTYLRRISEKVPPPPFQSWAITLPSACQDIHPPGALSIGLQIMISSAAVYAAQARGLHALMLKLGSVLW